MRETITMKDLQEAVQPLMEPSGNKTRLFYDSKRDVILGVTSKINGIQDGMIVGDRIMFYVNSPRMSVPFETKSFYKALETYNNA